MLLAGGPGLEQGEGRPLLPFASTRKEPENHILDSAGLEQCQLWQSLGLDVTPGKEILCEG